MYLKTRDVVRDVLIVFVVLALFFVSVVSAITVTPYNKFVIGNRTFTFSHTMNFHTITIADSYIVFNSTGFYVTSGNAITVTLVYLNSNIFGAGDGDKVLEFYAETIAGDVVFSFSGFPADNDYIVKRDGSSIATPISNGSGIISFTNNVWSSHLFEIFHVGEGAANNPPVVSGIPDQTITKGSSFTSINLDDYVRDVDNSDAEMTWSYFGNSQLSVSIVNRVATVVPSPDWTGSETVTFRATDPGGLWDEDSTTFTVTVSGSPPPSSPPSEPPSSSPGSDSGGGNSPPLMPVEVSGPTFVEMGVEYGYALSTVDPEGDGIRYRVDWGDGTISNWSRLVGSGLSVLFSHAWDVAGNFPLMVVAEDEHGLNTSRDYVFDVIVSGVNDSGSLPIGNFSVSDGLVANESIVFDAGGSFDIDGVVVSYFWDFGDGTNSTGVSVVHVYSQPGMYTVVLVITDKYGNIYSRSMDVTVAGSEIDEQNIQERQVALDISLTSVVILIVSAVASCLIVFFRKQIKSFMFNYVVSLFSRIKLFYSRYEIKRLAAKKEKLRAKTNEIRASLDRIAVKQVPSRPTTRFYSKMQEKSLKTSGSVVSDWKSLSEDVDRICTGVTLDKHVKTELVEAKSYIKVGSSFEDVNAMVDRLLSPADSKKATIGSSFNDYVERAVDELLMQKMKKTIDICNN